MNKLTLLLNDKEVIAEIAKDPEVQIKIKDAILDGALKRCTKIENGIVCLVSEQLKKEVFDNSRWCERLNKKYQTMVKDETEAAVRSFIRSEMNMLQDEVRKCINYNKALIMSKLESVDMDKIIREEVRKAVDEKFK